MALVIIVGLAAFIFIVMVWTGRQPYVKNRKQRKPHQKVTGGTFQGDPRSVAPHREEVVPPPREGPGSAQRDEAVPPRRR
jgi:hypothetical protein